MFDLASASYEELEEFMKEIGEASFRAEQVFDWMHVKHVRNIDDMTNLSKDLRETLKEKAFLPAMNLITTEKSSDGTTKFLFALHDKNQIESVWMEYKHGNSVCVSTQVGCEMGCTFCASTKGGLVRNLTAGEILYQGYAMAEVMEKKFTHLVLMGSGEPLENFDNVVKMMKLLNHEKGLNISMRNITLSTCGIIDGIRKLASENLPITLAVSLHAPNDSIRRKIMPVAIVNPMDDLLKACRDYTDITGRRLTIEYVLIDGVNDDREHARELASRLKGMLCHVNLIPVNPIKETNMRPPSTEKIESFFGLIDDNRIPVSVRRELGGDIGASCGQLRNRFEGGA